MLSLNAHLHQPQSASTASLYVQRLISLQRARPVGSIEGKLP